MLNYLWAFMLLTGIVFSIFTGQISTVTTAALDSSREAISLCITMMGVMAFWTGLMEIASSVGLVNGLSKRLRPFIKLLFPHLPENHTAVKYISTNIIANFLGLGWAATPAGLKAMIELEKLEDDRRAGLLPGPKRPKGVASNEMCTFLIINISSIQLIPVNIIAYRSQYGSVSPAAIVGAGIIATTLNTVVAIIYCRIHDH